MVDDLFVISGESEGGGDGAEPAEATVVLHVHVQPGAGRTAVVGRHGNALKVRVAAPPQAGRANDASAALLAETFGVGAAQVELVGGASSREKRFRISGIELDGFRRRLEQVVEEGKAGPGPEVRQGMR
ncbi:MAG: YggU family protein [Actinobacteria bacterium]|nr:MAG: YggU family protein [Actinomycetota bacterium]